MIVAHRGASRHAPENTIPAFELAWKDGADAIECDICQTKDGHIVCIHDGNTKRVADRDLVISESALDELREVDVGAHCSEEYSGTVIPTIEDVFSTIPNAHKIYIEIKCGTKIIPGLLEEIVRSGLKQEQVVVISFNTEVVREIKTQAPQFKAFWLSGFKKNAFGKTTPSLETVLETLKHTGADGFDSSKDLIGEPFVRSIMKHGYEYHVWTVDDLETAARFRKWGAKSITTNVPGYMRRNLVKQRVPDLSLAADAPSEG